MAVFDTGPGIVSLYENRRDLLHYYIDDKYEYYGLYRRTEVNNRIEFIRKFFEKDKQIIVMDFDAIDYFKDKDEAEYGEIYLKKNLVKGPIFCISSPLTKKEKTLQIFSDAKVDYFEASLLINACNDQVAIDILKFICDEYFKSIDFTKYEMIFLASSALHLRKDFFVKYFDKKILTNVDAIIKDYEYKKENLIRDYFHVSDSKRRFYSRAEKYLREKNILKDREILNVSKINFDNKKSP